ncbi:MAG: metallophosphoesterase [Clostridia bacterium]|nr:metallophosphoesterase [Clostridia bacterium]
MSYQNLYNPIAAALAGLFPGRAAAKKYTGQPVSQTDIDRNADLLWAHTLEKDPARDFVILNLTDVHMSDTGYRIKENPKMLKTVECLIREVKPDLITVTGDIVCGDATYHSIRRFTDFMESFDIPWAPVFGNHDDEGNCDLQYLADMMLKSPHCIMKKGDPEMGVGNYVVNITEEGRIVTSLFMMDSHHGLVNAKQMAWFSALAAQLNEESENGAEAAVFLHVPTAEYEYAYNAAYDPETKSYRDGYEAFGEKYEKVCCAWRDDVPYEEGFFGILKDAGCVKHIICGHEHMNDFSIVWDGIRLTYTMKVGKSSGYQPGFDGGTVITVGRGGIKRITHKTRKSEQTHEFYNIEDKSLR